MRYVWISAFMACLLLSAGCSQEKESETTSEVETAEVDTTQVETPSIEGAKAHVQKYIDRFLGGDETVRDGLLSFQGVGFARFNSIEIISSQQRYSESGEIVEGMFSIRMKVTGIENVKGRSIEKIIERSVINPGSGYMILGADF